MCITKWKLENFASYFSLQLGYLSFSARLFAWDWKRHVSRYDQI